MATDRSILFNGPMVRALLDGSKTQTRRVVKHTPDDWAPIGPEVFSPTVLDRHGEEQPGPDAYGAGNEDGTCWIARPYGKPGDRLWVRETWSHDAASLEQCRASYEDAMGSGSYGPYYRATETAPDTLRWKPSIHMPRWASRITLEIVSVRVERLQDITRGDAMAEGCPFPNMADGPDPRKWYAELWEQINGPGSWPANPWVWVIEFKRAKP